VVKELAGHIFQQYKEWPADLSADFRCFNKLTARISDEISAHQRAIFRDYHAAWPSPALGLKSD
jgi:hypothetical protein